MTFDEGSNQPPWGAPPPPPPSSAHAPGYIAPSPYGWGGAAREHPSGTTILVLGILSLVFCGLCGPFVWVMGNTAMREIDAQPGVNWTNRGAVSAGRTCGIVGSCFLILFALWLLLWVGIITSLAVR